MITLRPYQQTFVSDIRAAMAKSRAVLAVSPTGSGKTTVFSFITNGTVQRSRRVLIAVHRMEILRQISKALDQYNLLHGWIAQGHSMTNDAAQIGMIQTINSRLDRIAAPDLLIFDESHHVLAASYQALLAKYPNAFVLGVTATPLRLDGRGLGEIFDSMVIGPQTRELINGGFLAGFDYYAPQLATFDDVRSSMGDYVKSQINERMDKPSITGDAIAHYRRYLDGRTAIAFCITVAHAEHVAAQFRDARIPAASIDGKMSPMQREAICADLQAGRIKVMTSCELVSEGFDAPAVNGAILLRPTKSLAMFLQMCGRVLRIKPDGSGAVILDHVGCINTHGMPDAPRQWSLDAKRVKSKPYPIRTCEVCYRAFSTGDANWRDDATCGGDMGAEDCLLAPRARDADMVAAREIEHVAGELVAITETPDWAGGINIVRASGAEYKAMLDYADTVEKLKAIAKMRGYHHRWVYHIMAQRGGREAA